MAFVFFLIVCKCRLCRLYSHTICSFDLSVGVQKGHITVVRRSQ